MVQQGFLLVMPQDIPPHNLSEVIDAVVYRLTTPSAKLDKLMNSAWSRFPNRAIVQGQDEIVKAYAEMVEPLWLCAHEIEQLKGGKEQIIVTDPLIVNKGSC